MILYMAVNKNQVTMDTYGYIGLSKQFRHVTIHAGYLTLDAGSIIQSSSSLEVVNDADRGIIVHEGEDGAIQWTGDLYEGKAGFVLTLDDEGHLVPDDSLLTRLDTLEELFAPHPESFVSRVEAQLATLAMGPDIQIIDFQDPNTVRAVQGVHLSGNALDYDIATDQTVLIVSDTAELAPGDVVRVLGAYYRVTPLTATSIALHGQLQQDLVQETVSCVYRGVVVDEDTRLAEVVGDTDGVSAAHGGGPLPLLLPGSKSRITLTLKVVNRSYGLSPKGISVLCTGGDKANNEDDRVELQHRLSDAEASWSVSLLSNRRDCWYVD